MVEITGKYQGNLHCTARHGPSGSVLNTDAPRDNQGLGEAFSPTDLVATALGTCIATTMAIAARKHGVVRSIILLMERRAVRSRLIHSRAK